MVNAGKTWMGRALVGLALGGALQVTTLQNAFGQTPPPPGSVTEKANARTPEQWLESMNSAAESAVFRGRSIYLSGDQLTTVEILRGVVNGETWERVIQLGGEPAEILRKGNRIACLHLNGVSELKDASPMHDVATVGVSPAAALPAHWNSDQYKLREGPVERIAGRMAKRIDLIPVDRFRYGLHVWIDQDTSLLLKSIIADQRGRALDMFEFVSIEVGLPLRAEDFAPDNGLQWVPVEQDNVAIKASADWQPVWLPAGFKASRHVVSPPSSAVVAQSYSDGIAAFTLFIEPIAENDEMEGTRQHGATVAVSYRAPSPNDKWRVTVVGEVPIETAMQVASSVQRRMSAAP